MRIRDIFAASAAIVVISAGSAFAWGDMYMGDGTNNPNSGLMFSYDGENNCPAGLQPIVMGGVICCGTPNAGNYKEYMSHPAPVRKVRATPARAPQPRTSCYAVPGVKGVVCD